MTYTSRAAREAPKGLPPSVGASQEVSPVYSFPIIGIGASAGGLEALRLFFHDAQNLSSMSFIVVTHLDPTRKSLLVELLQKQNHLVVREAVDLESVQPGQVYVIPPNAVLTLVQGRFHLTTPRLPRGFRDPINSLFSSLAAEMRSRAAVVILSGTGTDGVHGAEEIKKEGGAVFIQDPTEAAFSGMPASIASLNLHDGSAPVASLPALIAQWRQKEWPQTPSGPSKKETIKVSPTNVQRVIEIIRDNSGHDFSNYRRGTILRRLKNRVEKTSATGVASYIRMLESDPLERKHLVDEMLINVTGFFRDPAAFEFIREKVFPSLLEQVDSSARHLRVWVPACASGEEAYSLAILFFEEMARVKRRVRLHIFATDIDGEALEKARDGVYPPEALGNLTKEQIDRFFVKTENGYRVSRKLRDVIVFAKHDLLSDAPLPKMLLVSCRNVFIYFDRTAQERIVSSSFAFSLAPRGFLFLGATETVPSDCPHWDCLSQKHAVYRREQLPTALTITTKRHLDSGLMLRTRNRQAPVRSGLLAEARAADASQKLCEQLLRLAAPPMFVVDSDNRVIFCSDKAKLFLRLGSGVIETKFDRIVHPEARWEMVHLIRSLRKSKEKMLSMQAVRVTHEDQTSSYFDIEATKVVIEEGSMPLIAITGYPVQTGVKAPKKKTAKAAAASKNKEKRQLEVELARLRTCQSATIAELEALNAELLSSNEEFGTMNEELQAATEELETNREELQSINEELQSVNAELSLKVQQLSDSNDDLYNLFSNNEFSIILLDSEWCVKRFTVQAGELLSLRESDVGRRISEFRGLFPIDFSTICQQVSQTLSPVEKELQITGGKWFKVRVLPYLNSDNSVNGLVFTLTDITEIRTYREALSRFQDRSKALVDSLPGNLLLCDGNGVVQYCKSSRSAFRLFDSDTATGKRVDELSFLELNIQREQLSEISQLAQRSFQEKTEKGLEVAVRIPRGPSLWFDVRCVPCGSEGVLIYFHEITDRKRLELELNRAVQTAELSSRAKTDFIANVSHELRTPLNAVIGFAQLLNRNWETIDRERSTEYIRQIEDSGRILLHLVNELLDLAQIDSGKLELHMAKTNIVALVRDCVSLMSHQFNEKGQKCALDLPVAPIDLFADEKRLRQVIINVVSNAAKYTPPESRIRVSASFTRQDSVCIEVADSGPGVAPDKLSTMFDRFVRHVKPDAAPVAGAGLGLAISKSIVEAHGGTVEASTPGLEGKGLKVTITLPMRTV